MKYINLKKLVTSLGIAVSLVLIKNPDEVNAYEINDRIFNYEELNDYFKDVDKNELLETLESNEQINNELKKYIKEFIEIVYKKYPNLNYRIFNENLKDLKIIEQSLKKIEKDNPNRKGYYDISLNKIYILDTDDIEIKKFCLFHELWHSFMILYIDDMKIIKSSTYGFSYGNAIDEGVTAYLTNRIYENNYLSYVNQETIIKILIEIYGEDIVYDYLDSGIENISYLLSLNSNYDKTNKFINNMDKELNKKISKEEIIFNYKYLIDIYFKNLKNKEISNLLEFQELLYGLDYEPEIRKEILNYFKDYAKQFKINTEVKYIVFNLNDSSKVYLMDDIFVVQVDNKKNYYVNSKILKEYLKTGYIYNVYEKNNTHYTDKPIIYSTIQMNEYINNTYISNIDHNVKNNSIYINIEKSENKVLTK